MIPELVLVERLITAVIGGVVLDIGWQLKKKKQYLATGKVGQEKTLKKLLDTEGLQISKKYTLSMDTLQKHVIIIAPTRAGKTTSVFIPNLLQNKLKGSIIIPDPKGELYKLTSKYQQEVCGRKVILYKPLEHGIEYNPLECCKSDREVMQLGQGLLMNGALSFELQTGKKAGGIEWLQLSQSLLNAALFHSNNLKDAVKLISLYTDDELDEIFASSNDKALTQYMMYKVGTTAKGMTGSIKGTLTSSLNLFTDDLAILRTDFTAEQFRKEPTALYISYPENKASYLSPLMAVIYSQLIDKLIDTKGVPITLMLDEFGNIGQLSNMSANISTAASREVAFVLCLQSLSQLKQIYGDNYKNIFGNCNTKILLPGISDLMTLDEMSKLCGEEQIEIMQENKKIKTKKQLFTPDELRRLDDGKCLILCTNKHPVIDEQNIYYTQQKYLNNVGG